MHYNTRGTDLMLAIIKNYVQLSFLLVLGAMLLVQLKQRYNHEYQKQKKSILIFLATEVLVNLINI